MDEDTSFQQVAEPLSPLLQSIWRKMQERQREDEQRTEKKRRAA